MFVGIYFVLRMFVPVDVIFAFGVVAPIGGLPL